MEELGSSNECNHNTDVPCKRWRSILVQDQQRNNYSKFMTILGDVSPYSKVVLRLNEASQYTWQVIWQFQFYLQTIVDLVLWLSNPSLSWLVFYNWFLEGFRTSNFGSELIALILYIVKLSLQRGSVLEARERWRRTQIVTFLSEFAMSQFNVLIVNMECETSYKLSRISNLGALISMSKCIFIAMTRVDNYWESLIWETFQHEQLHSKS